MVPGIVTVVDDKIADQEVRSLRTSLGSGELTVKC